MKLLLCLFALIFSTYAVSIGDRLIRTYTRFVPMPTNSSTADLAGWKAGACVPKLGVPYNFQVAEPQQHSPITLYMSTTGAVVGVGVDIYGSVEQKLAKAGFFDKLDKNHYRITVSFTNVDNACGAVSTPGSLGDSLIVNAGGIAHRIPVTEEEAVAEKWHKGSCFFTMGTHYFYDLVTAPRMSWKAGNVLPIVPMYSAGVINSFFFAATSVQQGADNANWWEPIPIPNSLMCYNTCDTDCMFEQTSFWSTLHIYLRDFRLATCPGGCQIKCCP